MLDIKFILNNVDVVKQNVLERYAEADIDKTVSLYLQLKQKRQSLRNKQHLINEISFKINKNVDAVDVEKLKKEATQVKEDILILKEEIAFIEKAYNQEMLRIPNIAAPEAPQGRDETNNIAIKFFGKPREFNFVPMDHVNLGKKLDIIDFDAGAKVTGSKFYFLKNEAVLLELGLTRYALEIAIKHGYTPVTTPEIVRDEIIVASGYSPRNSNSQIYSLNDGERSLIGTSEITIGGYMSDTILNEKDLPVKISGVSHCFRTEVGGGKKNKGLYRVHQFGKVELYQVTHPEKSVEAHEEMLSIEEEFYQSLGLPYRVLLMCKGDLGAPAYKKYDIEAWMPSISDGGDYGEVTSTSNCTDFQARRLKIKFKNNRTRKNEFVHTVNGTAVALTRTMLAIIENNQQEDGTILIPKILHPYVGLKQISPKE